MKTKETPLGGVGVRTILLASITGLTLVIVTVETLLLLKTTDKTLSNVAATVSSLTKEIQTQQGEVLGNLAAKQLSAAESALQSKARSLASLVAKLAPVPLLTMDAEKLDEYCQQVSSDPDVVFCYVRDASKKIQSTFQNRNHPLIRSLVPENKTTSVAEIARTLKEAKGTLDVEVDVALDTKVLGQTVMFVTKDSLKSQEAETASEGSSLKAKSEQSFQSMQEGISKQLRKETQSSLLVSIALGGIVGVFGLLCAVFIARAISKPLAGAVTVFERMADGDLTGRLEESSANELGRMSHALNQTLRSMSQAMQFITQNAKALTSSSDSLAAVSHQLSTSAEETSAQATSVSAAAEEVSANVRSVQSTGDGISASIKDIARSAAEASEVGRGAVQLAGATNQRIAKLGESTAEIGNVIKVITSIAEQTNLLALNAAIEAARAGDAGKGFAVVACEVKELAKETAGAAEDITRKLQAIQKDATGAISAIAEIRTTIDRINDLQHAIASAVEEQSVITGETGRNLAEAAKGTVQIAETITAVAEAAKNTSSGAGNTQVAARDLARMATELQELVGMFKF